MKLDIGNIETIDVNAFNPAAGPENDTLRIGRPVHVGIQSLHAPYFLQVLVQFRVNRPHGSTLQIFQEQRALGADPANEGKVTSVRRGRRPDRAARSGHEAFRLTGPQVMSPNLEDLRIRILRIDKVAARRAVDTEVDVTPVRGKRGLTEFFLVLLVRFLDHCDTGTTVPVVDPYLAGTERARGGEMLARSDIRAVG